MSLLNRIFYANRTSKGRVGFHTLYEEVIGPRREDPISLLEIGILDGRSIMAWLAYCPNAHITGIDTFERHRPEEVPALLDVRVRHYHRNSADRVPEDMGMFDFIIDDGCHWHCAQRMTFSRYWPTLRPGGTYFIEDVWPFDMMSDEDKQHPWLLEYPGAWTDDAYEGLLEQVSVGEVHHHDFRGIEGLDNSDHYVLEIKKPL